MTEADNFWRVQAPPAVTEHNEAITASFLELYQKPGILRTHLFEGRYENIYLNEQHIPQLGELIQEAVCQAEKILNRNNLRAGYWFNYMPPGATTTLHTHDDDDELLSGVYYLYAAENSGNLILHPDTEKIEITPQSGNFVFFKPDVPHQVSKNNSERHRLSIGMNFGPDH